MYHKFYDIKIKDKKYKIIFCDTYGLLVFVKNKKNSSYKKSLIDIMKLHRRGRFEILDFVMENYFSEAEDKKVKYLLIYNDEEVLSISRIIYGDKTGYINAVHTNKKFRKKKLCQNNLKKMIELTNKHFGIKKYILDVDSNNKPAIKCYKKIGFEIVEKIEDKYAGKYNKMVKKL
jgi:ribosomal protein S18 acetylase RimI-like enzyme